MAKASITPTVGRIVLYVANPGTMETFGEHSPIPAIVTATYKSDAVNLHVYRNDHGTVYKKCVEYSEGKEMGTWHWPPRV